MNCVIWCQEGRTTTAQLPLVFDVRKSRCLSTLMHHAVWSVVVSMGIFLAGRARHARARKLKVSKSRKKILKFSFAPKTQQKCFCISAVAYRKTSNQKSGVSPNVSTTPLCQWGFGQCLPFSWTQLRGKHFQHPITVVEVVDTFRLRESK